MCVRDARPSISHALKEPEAPNMLVFSEGLVHVCTPAGINLPTSIHIVIVSFASSLAFCLFMSHFIAFFLSFIDNNFQTSVYV